MSAAALVLIDIQAGSVNPVWGARNNAGTEANTARRLATSRDAGAPAMHIRQVSAQPESPLGPGPGSTFEADVSPLPGEPIFEKSVNSAVTGTGPEDHLRKCAIDWLVICGLTSPHLVSKTTRMAANKGFGVLLARDAFTSFAGCGGTDCTEWLAQLDPEAIYTTAISHLHGEFATALSTDTVLTQSP